MADDLEGDDIWGGGEAKTEDSTTSPTGIVVGGEDPAAEEDLDDDETRHMSIGELRQRIHLLNNDIRIMKSDVQRLRTNPEDSAIESGTIRKR